MASRPADTAPRRMELLNARVPDELRSALAAEAERRGVTVSEAVRAALALWIGTEAAA